MVKPFNYFKCMCKYKYYFYKYSFATGLNFKGILSNNKFLPIIFSTVETEKVSFDIARKMICGCLSVGHLVMGKDFTYERWYDWWINNKDKYQYLNEHTKAFINITLMRLYMNENGIDVIDNRTKSVEEILCEKRLKFWYSECEKGYLIF